MKRINGVTTICIGSVILLLLASIDQREAFGKRPADFGPNTFALLPYQAANYRYLVVPLGKKPPLGFEQPNFDDTGFALGSAAFGSGGNCPLQSTVQTNWPVNSQLLVRHIVEIPEGATNVRVMVSVNNDIVDVFFNGTSITRPIRHENCPIQDEFRLDVPLKLVHPGQNLIAFHVLDRGVESFFDARILAELSSDVLTDALLNLTDVVDSQLPKIPVSDIRVACPTGSGEISVNYSVQATGSNAQINITPKSVTDFTASLMLDGKKIATIQHTENKMGISHIVDTDASINNQNDLQNLISFSQILGSPSAIQPVTDCLSVVRQSLGALSCENSISSTQCLQCCREVADMEFNSCLDRYKADPSVSAFRGMECITISNRAYTACQAASVRRGARRARLPETYCPDVRYCGPDDSQKSHAYHAATAVEALWQF